MTTKEFIEKLAQDTVLNEKMAATKTAEEGYAAAKEAGLTDSFEAFTAALTGKELSDAELDHVAGGIISNIEVMPDWDWRSNLSRLSR